MYKTQLAAKVGIKNALNAIINAKLPLMLSALTPIVGQKIMKADGSIIEKIKSTLPHEDTVTKILFNASWSYALSRYDLKAIFKINASFKNRNGNEIAQYDDAIIYLGKLDGAFLKSLYDNHETRKTDYSIEMIENLREEVKTARKTLQEKESMLVGFGESDN